MTSVSMFLTNRENRLIMGILEGPIIPITQSIITVESSEISRDKTRRQRYSVCSNIVCKLVRCL